MMTRVTLPLVVLALGAGLCACGSTSSATPAVLTADASAGTASANPVAVSPEPGTPDASPDTQISFLGTAATTVSNVRVTGSRSGSHAGVLRAYSTGTGESFLPAHPFVAGEHVTVTAQVTSGGATGNARTSFTIAHQAPVSQTEFPNNPGSSHDVQHYSTAPSLTPSTVDMTTPAKPGGAPGDLFMAPYQGDGHAGADDRRTGRPARCGSIRCRRARRRPTSRLQQYDGKPVLTWWQGRILEVGFGQGEDVIANTSYQQVGAVRAGNGYHADLHEIRLAPDGTAWIDMFDPIEMNLSRYGGLSDGVITDSVIQEIDVKTGLVMWEWHALGHIPIGESHNRGAQDLISVGLRARQLGRPGPHRRRAAVLAQPRGRCMTWTCAAATSAGAWVVGTRASSSAPARARTGSTTPNGSRAG